jgi:hypothetical protein
MNEIGTECPKARPSNADKISSGTQVITAATMARLFAVGAFFLISPTRFSMA